MDRMLKCSVVDGYLDKPRYLLPRRPYARRVVSGIILLVSLRQATIAGRAGKLRMQPAIAVCYSEGGSLHCAPISGAINCSTHPRSLARQCKSYTRLIYRAQKSVCYCYPRSLSSDSAQLLLTGAWDITAQSTALRAFDSCYTSGIEITRL